MLKLVSAKLIIFLLDSGFSLCFWVGITGPARLKGATGLTGMVICCRAKPATRRSAAKLWFELIFKELVWEVEP